jgi:hypothetical protein
MFLVPINMSTFCFSHSKIFRQHLVPIKFLITTFGPIFNLIFVFFNEIVHKCVKTYLTHNLISHSSNYK